MAREPALPHRTTVTGTAAISAEKPWVRVQLSDGRHYEVHPDDLDELMKRDPSAKVLQ